MLVSSVKARKLPLNQAIIELIETAYDSEQLGGNRIRLLRVN